MELEAELALFESNRMKWVEDHNEKYVVIQDDNILDFFDTWEQALSAGFHAFGTGRSFLVKEVRSEDRIYFIGATA